MANPYVVGPPVIGEKYYRSREKIQQVLTDSQQLFLIADARRIGKTSFLRELERVADILSVYDMNQRKLEGYTVLGVIHHNLDAYAYAPNPPNGIHQLRQFLAERKYRAMLHGHIHTTVSQLVHRGDNWCFGLPCGTLSGRSLRSLSFNLIDVHHDTHDTLGRPVINVYEIVADDNGMFTLPRSFESVDPLYPEVNCFNPSPKPITGMVNNPGKAGGYNTVAIRDMLIAAFSDSELTTLCFDYFRTVYEDFSAGMGKGDKVQRLLDYVTRNNAFPELLGLVKAANPAKYAEFESRLTDNT